MKAGNPEVNVVLGLKWGDEGKGKIVDALTSRCDVVERFQGGANAGHTVANQLGVFALHTIPSGIFDPDKVVIIGSLVAFSPSRVIQEIEDLERRGVSTNKLVISSRAPLNLALYSAIDAWRETKRGASKIGTTKEGIGPTYADRTARDGLMAGDLIDEHEFINRLELLLADKEATYPDLKNTEEFSLDYYQSHYPDWMRVLDGKIQDTHPLTQDFLSQGKRFLLEGAQGVLLDNNWGDWPCVTSSNISIAAAYHAAGIPMRYHKLGLAVAKAYDSRVGVGGMPGEIHGKRADLIRDRGQEYGTTTGRARRIGEFDAVAGRYAQEMNGFDGLVVNSVDVLSGVGKMRICTGYLIPDESTATFPSRVITTYPRRYSELERALPVFDPEEYYIQDDFSNVDSFFDLLPPTQQYLNRISEAVGIPLVLVGKGRTREDLISVNGFSLTL